MNINESSKIIINNFTTTYSEEELERAIYGFYNRFIKRFIDLILASVLFAILTPLYVVISCAIILDDGFPVLYRAPRGGFRNSTFFICKFRTMVRNADKLGGSTTALNDKRVTKIGLLLRKTKIDETAQLLNIIKGEMSFIGPRPEALEYVNLFKGQEKKILQVRPGITDYSSIKYINLDEMVGKDNVDKIFKEQILCKKNILRIKYIAEISLKTDIKIFCSTVHAVVEKAFKLSMKSK